ncbi:MAG TPA: vitamin K epoxide reductase family protein [Polyangiaceae bacterium]|nr:vitamin K epoxide reductase family protein [Polyangiaceae bacterium]
MKNVARTPTIVALVGSVLGLIFSGYSTSDYMQHLDRQLHAVHCSFIPGMPAAAEADSGCRAAMYSAYSAFFRETWWGGIPISLWALAVYAFYTAFAVALLVGGLRASRRAYMFFGITSVFPVVMSVIMAVISAVKLGSFCKTCIGMYIASILLVAGGVWAWLAIRKLQRVAPADGWPEGYLPDAKPAWIGLWLIGMGISVLLPTLIYVTALPDYRPRLASCGKLPEPADTNKALLKLATAHPKRPATLFVDPLCPTCKSLHQRLEAEGVIDNLDLSVALFPLDNTCNWMIDRALHAGSCVLARAVLCADPRSREALDWMYSNQEELTRLGKSGEPLLRARVRERFGAELDACIDAKSTKLRLNNILQYSVNNHIPVSTPQMYLGDQRICDEDTDLGMRFTLGQLAPEVLR